MQYSLSLRFLSKHIISDTASFFKRFLYLHKRKTACLFGQAADHRSLCFLFSDAEPDFWKGIASIGVILVHIQFPGVCGKITAAVGTCGVILFFLLSGYSIYNADADRDTVCKRIMKRFRRNGRITLIAVAVFFAFTCVEKCVAGGFGEWIAGFADPVIWLRMVFLGDFEIIGGDPLWFMPALLYGYLIFWVIYRFGLQKIAQRFCRCFCCSGSAWRPTPIPSARTGTSAAMRSQARCPLCCSGISSPQIKNAF